MSFEWNESTVPAQQIAQQLRTLATQAIDILESEVNSVIAHADKQEQRIEHLLDQLLGFCYDESVLVLFKRLCRYYYTFNPAATADYVSAYREMWDCAPLLTEGASALPHPDPLPKGEGVKSTRSEIGTISSPLPPGEDLGEGAPSPLSLRERARVRETTDTPKERTPEHLIKLAKKLRQNQTNAEIFMRRLLRNRQLANAKFRRQHPIEDYIADFYCHEHKLIVELDGGQHFTDDGIAKDAQRTARLNTLGIEVMRFDNRQVFTEIEGVLQMIYERLTGPYLGALSEGVGAFPHYSLQLGPHPRPHPNPLPKGEGVKSTHSEIGTIRPSSPLPQGEDLGEGSLINTNLAGLGYE